LLTFFLDDGAVQVNGQAFAKAAVVLSQFLQLKREKVVF
jgi:hypothetical protein